MVKLCNGAIGHASCVSHAAMRHAIVHHTTVRSLRRMPCQDTCNSSNALQHKTNNRGFIQDDIWVELHTNSVAKVPEYGKYCTTSTYLHVLQRYSIPRDRHFGDYETRCTTALVHCRNLVSMWWHFTEWPNAPSLSYVLCSVCQMTSLQIWVDPSVQFKCRLDNDLMILGPWLPCVSITGIQVASRRLWHRNNSRPALRTTTSSIVILRVLRKS